MIETEKHLRLRIQDQLDNLVYLNERGGVNLPTVSAVIDTLSTARGVHCTPLHEKLTALQAEIDNGLGIGNALDKLLPLFAEIVERIETAVKQITAQ